jgi:hypothetical protein
MNDKNNNTRTKKKEECCTANVYQFNTGDEDDEKADSNEYSINKRTKEQHSAEFCLSHKSSMKDTQNEEKKKEDNDDKRLQGRSFTNSF